MSIQPHPKTTRKNLGLDFLCSCSCRRLFFDCYLRDIILSTHLYIVRTSSILPTTTTFCRDKLGPFFTSTTRFFDYGSQCHGPATIFTFFLLRHTGLHYNHNILHNKPLRLFSFFVITGVHNPSTTTRRNNNYFYQLFQLFRSCFIPIYIYTY